MKMKREGAVGLILIAILVVVMLVFLRGKSLEDIMGSGYTQADVTEITATVTGADEIMTTDFAAGDQGYLDLISLLQEPSYSRTFTSDDSGALDYAVTLTFTGSGDQTHLHGTHRPAGEPEVSPAVPEHDRPHHHPGLCDHPDL